MVLVLFIKVLLGPRNVLTYLRAAFGFLRRSPEFSEFQILFLLVGKMDGKNFVQNLQDIWLDPTFISR